VSATSSAASLRPQTAASPPSYDDLRQYLLAVEKPTAEAESHRVWVEVNLPRFERTLELVPPGTSEQRCLELGARPFTFTLLMKRFRDYQLSLVDFFTSDAREYGETLRLPALGEEHALVSALCDVEHETLPFADASFDGVLCCEILEHLTADPTAMLRQIHRVLKPGGWMVLTTPNVANVVNLLHLAHGRNVYHPYEADYGPTWRHNREYTTAEVVDLVNGTGFEIDHIRVENAAPPGSRPPLFHRLVERLLRAWYGVDYGHQLYLRARRGPTFRDYRPTWLYTGADRNLGLLGGRLSPPSPGTRRSRG
jgi:SAM-dependent methyltransferase